MAGIGGGPGAGSAPASGMDLAMALAPVALSMAPYARNNPQMPTLLALMASMSKTREDRAKEERESAAAADLIQELGLKAKPGLSAAEQLRGGTLQDLMRTRAEAEAERQRRAGEEAINRAAHGGIASLQARIGTTDPEQLQQSAGDLAPFVGRTPALTTEHGKLLDRISESAARLASAQAVARPFETRREYPGHVPPPLAGYTPSAADLPSWPGGTFTSSGKPLSLGVKPVELPPQTAMEVPENVHALQRLIMATGEAPTKDTASGIAAQFNVPIEQLPGGPEAKRALIAPRHQFTAFPHNAAGTMTPVTVYDEPATGLPTTRIGDPIPGVSTPQRPERPQAHERLESLGYVIAGVPDKAQPQDRRLTPAQAQTVRNAIARAEQQMSPKDARDTLLYQIKRADEAVKRVEAARDATPKNSPKRARAERDLAQLQIERQALEAELTRYNTPGRINRSPAAGAGVELPDAAEFADVIK